MPTFFIRTLDGDGGGMRTVNGALVNVSMPRNRRARNRRAEDQEADEEKESQTLLEKHLCLVSLAVCCLASGCVGHSKAAQEVELRTNLDSLGNAIAQYRADRACFPSTLEELLELGYLSRLPHDPITRRHDTWVPVLGESDSVVSDECPDEPVLSARPGSDALGLDGRPYSGWRPGETSAEP